MLEAEARSRQTAVLSKQEAEELLETVRKEFLANWVIQRLTLDPAKGTLGMKKLFGDKADNATMPENPAIAHAIPMATPRAKVDMKAFTAMSGEVRQSMRTLSTDTQGARKMMQRLSISIDAFANVQASTKGSHRNKYVWAFLRWIRKKEVAQMQKVLDNSPIYQSILQKDAETRVPETV